MPRKKDNRPTCTWCGNKKKSVSDQCKQCGHVPRVFDKRHEAPREMGRLKPLVKDDE